MQQLGGHFQQWGEWQLGFDHPWSKEKFEALAILNFHKDMTDEINFVEIHLLQVMKMNLTDSGNLIPMMNCELFVFPNSKFLIWF